MAKTHFVVSVAGGYGGAERDIEVFLRAIPSDRSITVFASSPYHLERLRAYCRSNVRIEEVDLAAGLTLAASRFVKSYLTRKPDSVLVNTLEALKIVAIAAPFLPAMDSRTFFFVRDFQWTDFEGVLAALPAATMLVPHPSIFDRPNYIASYVRPDGPFRSIVVPSPAETAAASASGSLGSSTVDFLHLATVNGMKGHHDLVKAFEIVRRTCTETRLISCGHRPDAAVYEAVREAIRRASLQDVVELHEHVPDPATFIANSRAVLVATTVGGGGPETFGRTIIEAWAHKRPVIAYAVGAPRHLVRHRVDGLLVAEGDIVGLADAILDLAADGALADELGRAGFARIESEFAASIVTGQILELLDGGWHSCAAPSARAPSRHGYPPPRIYLDVTLLLRMGWHKPVGLSRVLTEVADHLLRDEDAEVVLVRDGGSAGPGFYHLTPEELEFLAHRRDKVGRLASGLLADVPRVDRRWEPSPLFQTLLAFLGQLVGWRTASLAGIQRWLKRFVDPPGAGAPSAEIVIGESESVLIGVTNPWDFVPPKGFEAFQARGAKYLIVVHDLMVWETPQLTAGRDPREYTSDMLATLQGASALVTVSNHTAAVVSKVFEEDGRLCPPITTAHPSPGLAAMRGTRFPPSGFDTSRVFVLVCATIEIRKNHSLLLHVWERLRADLSPEKLPRLVFAGSWGWGAETVRAMIERNWRLTPHLCVLNALDDDELLWLYENAAFTVCPSLNEGFGLPVAESLRAGTPVLISDIPALVESSEGLMPSIDPNDLSAWIAEIRRLCLDEAYLQILRERARRFRGSPQGHIGRAVTTAIECLKYS